MEYVVEFQNVYKYYHVGDSVIRATDDVSFKIKKGEFAVVVGPSGAGKTTILNLEAWKKPIKAKLSLTEVTSLISMKNNSLTIEETMLDLFSNSIT